MTNQPIWKLIANLGDVNPLEYGGYFIFEDETGVYPPEAELLTSDDDETYYVYRFSLDRCKMERGYEDWFAKDLASVASFIGSNEDTLQSQLCSADPIERAYAYRAIGDYHGFENFDSYPLTLTFTGAEERYRGI